MKARIAALCIGLVLTLCARAETIRGQLAAKTTVPEDTSITLQISPNDLVSVELGEEYRLLDAVDIDLTVPERKESLRGTLALYVFAGVSPAPSFDTIGYQGTELFFQMVDPRTKLSVRVPVAHAPRNSADPAQVRVAPVTPKDFPLLIVVLPVSKGVPEAATNADIALSILSVRATDRGILKLEIDTPDEGEPFVVSIDGNDVRYQQSGYVLPPGFHRVAITSDSYEDRSLTVAVDAGKISVVPVSMEQTAAMVEFVVPEAAEVFFDGERVPSDTLFVQAEPGEHTIVVRLGTYSLTRRLTAAAGRAYQVSLDLDLRIDERDHSYSASE